MSGNFTAVYQQARAYGSGFCCFWNLDRRGYFVPRHEERQGGRERVMPSSHQVDARGGAQGGRYRRKDGDGELDDFLPKFFFHGISLFSYEL